MAGVAEDGNLHLPIFQIPSLTDTLKLPSPKILD